MVSSDDLPMKTGRWDVWTLPPELGLSGEEPPTSIPFCPSALLSLHGSACWSSPSDQHWSPWNRLLEPHAKVHMVAWPAGESSWQAGVTRGSAETAHSLPHPLRPDVTANAQVACEQGASWG